MRKDIELAKQQGLNWQALLIEECQSELKVIIQDSILKRLNFNAINKRVQTRINELVNELDSEALKERSKTDLNAFATRIYVSLKQVYFDYDLAVLLSIKNVANNTATIRESMTAEKALKGDIPRSVFERAVPLDIYAKDYMQMVKERLIQISQIEAKEDYSSRVSLRNVAEMQVRHERQLEELQKVVDGGHDLVWIVPHANCSERCEPWQGKLYSIKGDYGTKDGIDYQPLSNATDRYEVTKSGKVYKNGTLSGFNCRHKIEVYKKGTKPVEIPASVVDSERKVNDEQRYLERGVRAWKERALMFKGIDTREYVYSREKAKEWNERYIEYSKKNNVAYYPSRTQIL